MDRINAAFLAGPVAVSASLVGVCLFWAFLFRTYRGFQLQVGGLAPAAARYAGFSALLPTMAGAANRCVIPEHPFDVARLCELLVADRTSNPSRYSVALVSEGAKMRGMDEMVYSGMEADAYGHRKKASVGEALAEEIRCALRCSRRRRRPAVHASATCSDRTRSAAVRSPDRCCRPRSPTSGPRRPPRRSARTPRSSPRSDGSRR